MFLFLSYSIHNYCLYKCNMFYVNELVVVFIFIILCTVHVKDM